MGAYARVKRVGGTVFYRFEIAVEIDVRDVVFLEKLGVILCQYEIGNTVFVGLGQIFRIDCRLCGTKDKQELGAMLAHGFDECKGFLHILFGFGFGVFNGAIFFH